MSFKIALGAFNDKGTAATEVTEFTEKGQIEVFLCALCVLCGNASAVFPEADK